MTKYYFVASTQTTNMFRISFGSNNTKNGSTVNKDATLTAPTLLVPADIPVGYYTVTMVGIDEPFLHWIKVNMPSTMKSGKEILVYEPPFVDPLIPVPGLRRYVVTLWGQTRGRLTPPPRAPASRTRFSLPRFAKKHGLAEVMSIGFSVS